MCRCKWFRNSFHSEHKTIVHRFSLFTAVAGANAFSDFSECPAGQGCRRRSSFQLRNTTTLHRFSLFAAAAGACAGARAFHWGSVQLQLHVQMQLHVQLQVHVQVHVQAQVQYHSCRCICKCVCTCSCKCMCMCTDSVRYFLFFQARRCSERFCRL